VEDVEGLPEGAAVLGDPTSVAVHCVEPSAAPEEEEVSVGEAAEPEVLGRKAEEQEEEQAKK